MLPTQQTRIKPTTKRPSAKRAPHIHRWIPCLDQRYERCTCEAYRYNQRPEVCKK